MPDDVDIPLRTYFSRFYTKIKNLIDTKAPINHEHGYINKDGEITGQALKNVVTNSNGKIITEDKPIIPTKTSQLTNDSNFLTQHQDISGKEDKTNKVTSWSQVTSDDKYPSEKLVNDSLKNKINKSSTNGLVKNDGTIDTNNYLTQHQDISGKVDKETGKGLSTNDYTTTEKNKLAGIETGANKTIVDSALSSSSTNPVQNKVINTALNNKVDKVEGKGLSTNDYTTEEKTKLSGIAIGANKTTVDSSLSSSSTNPVQNKVINTALGTKVDKIDGKGLSTEDYTTEEKTKLSGIETGANKTTVDSSLSSSSTNPVQNKVINSALNDLDDELNTKVDKVTGKGLSTEDYTTTEKTKLNDIEEGANNYIHPSYTARTGKPTSKQTPEFGETATVSQIKSDATGHITSVTDRTIKIPDTEASTTAHGLMSSTDKTKLDGVETGATKNSAGTGLNNNNGELSVKYGSGVGTACQGNDSRLSDARTPKAHNQASSTITDTNTYSNIGNVSQNQQSINSAIDTKIGALLNVDLIEVVGSLSTASANTLNKLYLVAESTSATNDNYEIYITVKTGTSGNYSYNWEKVDTARLDLSDYATVQALNELAGRVDDIINGDLDLTNFTITGQASKNVVTDSNGNITTENKYSHPSIHPATMITDSNAHSNIGSNANANQGAINTAIDTALSNKQAKGNYATSGHTHDNRYYTETEINNKLADKSKVSFTQTKTTGIEIGKITIDGTETPIYQQDNNTVYTHPDSGVTAGTNQNNNQTPSFNSTFNIPKLTFDSKGHITNSQSSTVKLPALPVASTQQAGIIQIGKGSSNASAGNHTHDDRYFTETEVTNKLATKSDNGHTHTKSEITDLIEATISENGLMSSTDKTNLNKLVDRYNGVFVAGTETVTKPYLRLFNITSAQSSSSSSHLIFEFIGNNNDRQYAKIRVDVRQNDVTKASSSSTYTITPLEVYGFDLNSLYFGFIDNHTNNETRLDIYRKVGSWVNFYVRIADDHLRNGSYSMYSPVVNGREAYTNLSEASTTLYNKSYTSTSQGGSYGEITNTIPYTNITANKFVKRGGNSSQFLKADGSIDGTTYVATTDDRLSDERVPIDNSVTSDKIVDGTIKNDDIASNAEIVYSKLSGVAPTSHTDSNGAYGKATTDVWGHTKLNSAINSTDETTSATPKAVKTTYDIAKPLDDRYKGVHFASSGTNTTKPYYRLFHIQSGTATAQSSSLIFEISSKTSTLYAKVKVYMRQNAQVNGAWTQNSTCVVKYLEVSDDFDKSHIKIGFNNTPPNTSCDIYLYMKIMQHTIIRVIDDQLRDGTYTQYSPTEGNVEAYTSIENAGTILYNQAYTNIITPEWTINATTIKKSDGTSSQFLKADGSVATFGTGATNVATGNHTHGSISSSGTLNSDISSVNKLVVTDSNNNVKTISKLPLDKVTHPDISGKEDTSNRIQDISANNTATGKYPSAKAVVDYAQPIGNYANSTHTHVEDDIIITEELSANSNLNNLKTQGLYTCTSTYSESLANKPFIGKETCLIENKNYRKSDTNIEPILVQTVYTIGGYATSTYVRTYNGGNWSTWRHVAGTGASPIPSGTQDNPISLNNYKQEGLFTCPSANNYIIDRPFEDKRGFFLYVLDYRVVNYLIQIVIPITNDNIKNKVYYRIMYGNGVWKDWNTIATIDDIPDISGKADKTGYTANQNLVTNSSGQIITEPKPAFGSSTPGADTINGSAGGSNTTTFAKSDHIHPKSSLYAEAGHKHNHGEISSGNIDELFEEGTYGIKKSQIGTNITGTFPPTTKTNGVRGFLLENKLYKDDSIVQFAYMLTATNSYNRVYYRIKPASSYSWGDWIEMPFIDDVITKTSSDNGFLKSNGSVATFGTGNTDVATGNHTHDDRYYTETEIDNLGIEYIEGTHGVTATPTWEGTSTKISSLQKGQVIFFRMTSAGTSAGDTLNLTLKDGTPTGNINIYYNASTKLTTHFPQHSVLTLVYDGSKWITTEIQNTNNYDRLLYTGQIVANASTKLIKNGLVCGKNDGLYYNLANAGTLDIRYKILWTGAEVAVNGNSNNVYSVYSDINLGTTKSGTTVANYKRIYIEGTALSGSTFTISSSVFKDDSGLVNGNYYIPIGYSFNSSPRIRFSCFENTVFHYTTSKGLVPYEDDKYAPISHATNSTTYGGGNSSNYGHVKLSDSYTSSGGNASQSVGASSKAVVDLKGYVDTLVGDINNYITS